METTSHINELYKASLNGSVATLNRLIQEDPSLLHSISLTPSSKTPLHLSALYGHLEFTKTLLTQKPGLTTEVDSLRRSPLHLASAEGHTEIVKALLEVNRDVCLTADQDGRIPLHFAVMRGRVDVIGELFDAKPESVYVKLDGETVLHLCVRYNHLESLKLLVSVVDDDELLNSRNLQGHTILDLAATLKQLKNISYLLSVHDKIKPTAIEIEEILMKAGVARGKIDDPAYPPSSVLAGFEKWVNKYIKRQGNWIEKTRETLMLVATVMATIAFQAVITNPPGGFFSKGDLTDVCKVGVMDPSVYSTVDDCMNDMIGTSPFSYYWQEPYQNYVIFNCVSFTASIGIIFLTTSGLPLVNKFFTWCLTLAMTVAVACLALAFMNGLNMVIPFLRIDDQFIYFYNVANYVWMGLIVFVGVFYTLRFLYWLVKKMVQCKSHKPQTSSSSAAEPVGV